MLWKNDSLNCPFLSDTRIRSNQPNQKQCAWPGELVFEISNYQALFSQTWQVYGKSIIEIPGDTKNWPKDITINGKQAILLDIAGRPALELLSGTYLIKGIIPLRETPKALRIPAYTGDLNLSMHGIPVKDVVVETSGRLLLNGKSPSTKLLPEDSLSVQVFRKLSDGYPLQIETQLVLDVTGKERLVTLGRALSADFIPTKIISPLPSRLKKNGDMDIQVRQGRWTITLHSRERINSEHELSKQSVFTVKQSSEDWPNQELWAFVPAHQYRIVEIDGLNIDPTQSALPREWHSYATYTLSIEKPLILTEVRRSQSISKKHSLKLHRDIWISANNKEMISKEELYGSISRIDRISANMQYQPGRISINGTPQLLTLVNEKPGIEVRPGPVEFQSVGRIKELQFSISPWQVNVDSATINLHLPPGYRLFHAKGADHVSASYISSWNLMNIFIATIFVVILVRVFSRPAGLCGVLYVLLTHDVPNAPQVLHFIIMIGFYSAAQHLKEGKFKKLMGFFYFLSAAILVISFLVFAVEQARQAFYPQLEKPWKNIQQEKHRTQRIQAPVPDAEVEFELMKAAENGALSITKMPADKTRFSKMESKQRTPDYYHSYEEDRLIQTGPGIPSWRWNQSRLSWSGAITSEQNVSLILIPPALNRSLNIARIFVFAALVMLIFKLNTNKSIWPSAHQNIGVFFGLILMGGLVDPDMTHAEEQSSWPDSILLKELESRLLAPPDCFPNCLSMNELSVQATLQSMTLVFSVSASTTAVMPLPLNKTHIGRIQIRLGKQALPIRLISGSLHTVLPEGNHQVHLTLDVNKLDEVVFEFTQAPHRVVIAEARFSESWRISGLRHHRLLAKSLSLQRKKSTIEKQAETNSIKQPALPPFVQLERRLQLENDWIVTNRLVRISPEHGALNISMPLLKGESVLSENVKTEDGKVLVSLAAKQRVFKWESLLKKEKNISLLAPARDDLVERWIVNPGIKWNMTYSGLAPIQDLHPQRNQIQWWPRSGERLFLNIQKPIPSKGQSLTIDAVGVDYRPGRRSSSTNLSLEVRTSLGMDFRLPIPADAEVETLEINQRTSLINMENKELVIPLQPGKNRVKIKLQQDTGYNTVTRIPPGEISDASNINLQLSLPRERWVLWVSGPSMGPAVLFWGVLLVIVFVSLVLGRQDWSVLKSWQWCLLGIGLATTYLPLMMFIFAWFILLSFRPKIVAFTRADNNWRRYNALQVFTILMTVAMVISIFASVGMGLIFSEPDMQVIGNGSTAHFLNWYQDMSQHTLPSASVISVPIWAYRLLFLAWSIWLSLSSLNWLKWGWKICNEEGVWKPKPIKDQSDTE